MPIDYGKQWYSTRLAVLRRDGWRCVVCGADVRAPRSMRIDHIVPVRECPGRLHDLQNLRTLCVRCDARRHSEKGGGQPKPLVNADGYKSGW